MWRWFKNVLIVAALGGLFSQSSLAQLPGTSSPLAGVAGAPAVLDCNNDGNVTYAGGQTIHTFTGSGTLTCPTARTVNYLVVGGGGGGGGLSYSGGGGAGGLKAGTISLTTSTTITVGAGGPGGVSATGTAGSSSCLGGTGACGGTPLVISHGGAGGAISPANGTAGASGSGGSVNNGASTTGGAGTAGEGNNGGGASVSLGGAGGGGGAGAAGANGNATPATAGGAGGAGLSSSISGTSKSYAGGGGGGVYITAGFIGGTGGAGGGGTGASTSNNLCTAGAANSGGGGGGMTSSGTPCAGGIGVVIVSYPTGTTVPYVPPPCTANTDGGGTYANVLGLWHFDNAGTDNSGGGRSLTLTGGALYSTTQSKFGGYALNIVTTATSYAALASAGLILSGDFTAEGWFYLPTLPGTWGWMGDDNATGIGGFANPTLGFAFTGGNTLVTPSITTLVTANAWHHMAWVRQTAKLYFYYDGVLQPPTSGVSFTPNSTWGNSTTPWKIGRGYTGSYVMPSASFIDEVRVSNIARYTSTFTPQTTAFCNN